MALAQAVTSTSAELNQRLVQAEQELQAIKNHQAVQPISIFHWSEPKLWLLLFFLVVALGCLNAIRRRAKRRRTAETPVFDRQQAEVELRQAFADKLPTVTVKPRKRQKSK